MILRNRKHRPHGERKSWFAPRHPALNGDREFQIEGTTLTAYREDAREARIPEGVTAIGEWAFFLNDRLTSVVIPEGVTLIGDGAFWGCSSLARIELPASVKSIGNRAFGRCGGLEQIIVAAGNPVYRSEGDCLIENQTDTVIFGCKNSVIPESVTAIGDRAFQDCNGLSCLVIPAGVTAIGKSAFVDCVGPERIEVAEGNPFYRVEGGCLIENEMNTLILGCNGGVVPSGVTAIGSYAFLGCGLLTDIELPAGVISIGECAFSACRSLTSIEIPKSVKSIGNYAFSGCSGIRTIRYPGTKRQWKQIKKEKNWDADTNGYTVVCADGEIPKV